MEKYFFNCHGNNAPAYSCDKPNDNSGHYYQSADVDDLIAKLQRERDELIRLVEGPACHVWVNELGLRLKDTSEWAEFYTNTLRTNGGE